CSPGYRNRRSCVGPPTRSRSTPPRSSRSAPEEWPVATSPCWWAPATTGETPCGPGTSCAAAERASPLSCWLRRKRTRRGWPRCAAAGGGPCRPRTSTRTPRGWVPRPRGRSTGPTWWSTASSGCPPAVGCARWPPSWPAASTSPSARWTCPAGSTRRAGGVGGGLGGWSARGGRRRGAAGRARRIDVPVVSVDLPSGVDPLTGAVEGAAIDADVTVTFGGYKPAHVLTPAAAHCGRTEVVDIGLDGHLDDPELHLLEAADVGANWPVPG